MPRLNLKNLHRLMSDTIAYKGDTRTVEVRSLIDPSRSWRFSTVALGIHRVRVASMLSQVILDMLQSMSPDGTPWFYARRNRWGEVWGDLEEVDKLLAIGRASGMVRTHVPRTDCEVSYAVILDNDVRHMERSRPDGMRNPAMLYWKFKYYKNK